MISKRNLCIVLVFCMLPGGCAKAQETISVSGLSEPARIDVPVEVKPGDTAKSAERLAARSNRGDDGAILFQQTPSLFYSEGPDLDSTYVAVLPESTTNGTYQVASTNEGPAFSFVDNDGRLRLKEGDLPILAYNYGMQLAPGVPERYRRSTYIHPIWDLQGRVVTGDFPEDHYHHRGLSWMWPRVIIGGAEYDLWALRGIQQVFEEWLARDVGPVCATIGAKNSWRLEGGHKIMDEWVWVRTFKAGQYGRVVDIRLRWEALAPIQLSGRQTKNKGYGGFSLRFGPREETVIATEEGVEERDSDHKRAPWADESGKFRGADDFSGLAIFQHSGNPDFPAEWTLRHYGFLGVAWPGTNVISVEPGESFTLRYRVWVHRGDAEAGRVAEAYEAFANPPTVQVPE